MKFLIINGPNLNLLGQREPDVYGPKTYDDLCGLVTEYAAGHGAAADCFQSNHEGAIIDAIHAAQGKYDAIIINPGAYTHYSYAIHDALKAVPVPAYEVHLSDIQNREDFRKVSVTAPACVGQIYGLGFDGYLRAMDHFLPPAQTAPAQAEGEGDGALCVIGDPVAHSKSPLIQNAMLRSLGLEPVYTTRTVTLEELPAFVAEAKASGALRGFNATMPHKRALLSLLDEVDEEALRMGAVNTVCLEGGRAVGHNTDGRGFLAAMEEALGISPLAGTFTVLGAGGAARAVAVALARAGARTVYLASRDPKRSEDLSMFFPAVITPAPFDPETLRTLAGVSQAVVNCTSLGMTGKEDFGDLSFLSALPAGGAVCDLVYEPAETSLLRAARAEGRPAMGGLGMLIHQAVYALEHFLGRELDHAALAQVARKALAEG